MLPKAAHSPFRAIFSKNAHQSVHLAVGSRKIHKETHLSAHMPKDLAVQRHESHSFK